MHVKKGDEVVVLAGNEKGKRGKVLRTMESERLVIVEGVNVRTKTMPKTPQNPQGGTVNREVPVAASNVLIWSEKAGKGVRTRMEGEGSSKARVGIPCGTKFN
ncbi:MAG: 50S ribosomal protein L24 [Planctomycetota bacterium]|jgi:large subunit ribosomal protein L24|nr:50S ribosomal protein L24 [Planctomycetota bacterium]MDP6941828.1 50S ribosomal protein L24 [Planctomycetota bacterium]